MAPSGAGVVRSSARGNSTTPTGWLYNRAAISAARGRRTRVVDLDPQVNTSRYLLGAALDERKKTLVHFFDDILAYKMFADKAGACVVATPFAKALPMIHLDPRHKLSLEFKGLYSRLAG
ncbi:MAG: AAA family ATPase [Candidatus Contendobacter sp.]|nr:AAA family ATPase [Candidatus Contendobacter sp.]